MEQSLEPFPQFGGYFPVYEHNGTALYNTAQVQVEKRFSNGLSYLASLTMGRLRANTAIGSAPFSPNGLNAFNTRPEYVPSYLDQVYSQKVATAYELPIGQGKKFLNSKGFLSKLIGGWEVSAILTYAGGTPMGATNDFNPLLVNSFDRPNIVPSVTLKTFNYNISKPYLLGGQQRRRPYKSRRMPS